MQNITDRGTNIFGKFQELSTTKYPSLPLSTTKYHSEPLSTIQYHSVPLHSRDQLQPNSSHKCNLTKESEKNKLNMFKHNKKC